MNLDRVKKYLAIEWTEDDDFLTTLIEVSQILIDRSCGEAYKLDTQLTKLSELLQLKIIADMYENRTTDISTTLKKDSTYTTIVTLLGNAGVENV